MEYTNRCIVFLTWYIPRVLGQFLSAEEDREWVSAVVWLVNLPDLHCVVRKEVVENLCEIVVSMTVTKNLITDPPNKG